MKEERSWRGDVRAHALVPVKHTPGESGHLLRATATRRRAYGGPWPGGETQQQAKKGVF